MSELTAIDVLVEPDRAMVARAEAVNARMLTSIPGGFALDEHHRPHITTLQRYVRSADLDRVFDAVGTVLETVDVGRLRFTAIGLKHMEVAAVPGAGLAGVVARPSPEVIEFQARLIEAVAPFTASGGSGAAYVRTEADPEINQATIDYIEHYVPAHSGENYLAHVTVGLATLDDLARIEAEPFEELDFSPGGVHVYQLGNNGVAARRLRSWPVPAPAP